MSINDDIRQSIQNNKAALESERKSLLNSAFETDEPKGFQQVGMIFGNEVPASINVNEYLQAMKGWVYGCVTAIADAVSKIDFDLYRLRNGEIEKVEDHPILDLLYRVNPFQTQYDHFCLTQQYLELTGEAPWFVDRGETGEQEPQNILLLRPDKLRIVKSGSGSLSPIDGYMYEIEPGKDPIKLSMNEIIFLKYPDPNNMFRGKGTLAAAATTVDIDNYAEEFNRRFFFNSARPDSIVSTDQKLTPKQREELRGTLKKLYGGAANAHKTAILESGLKWEQMSVNQKDMDFMEQQRFTQAKILSIFRVPKPIVAISDDVNLANAKTAEYVFAKWTVKPKLVRIVSQLNEFFVPMFKDSEGLFLSFDDPVPQDIDMDLKRYDSGLSKGYMTVNEVRNEIGLDPIGEEGDVLYIPNSYVPIGTPPPTGAPIGAQGIQLSPTAKSNFDYKNKMIIANSGGGYGLVKRKLAIKARKAKRVKEKIGSISKNIDAIANAMARDMMRKSDIKKKALKQEVEANKEKQRGEMNKRFGDEFIKAADQFEKTFKYTTKREFERQRDLVLDLMPKKSVGSKAVEIGDYLLDEEDESQILVRVYTPQMRKIIKERGIAAGKLVDSGFDEATKPVQRFIKARTLKFSFDMTVETNRLLKGQLSEGIAAGEGIPKLRDRVKTLFDDMSNYRSERIARSEVIRASNFAAREAYKQSGVCQYMEWMATNDDRTDPDCEALDGKKIKLTGSFDNNPDAGDGYEITEYPPLHPNCRCTVLPVIGKALSAEEHKRLRDLDDKKADLEDAMDDLNAKNATVDAKLKDLENQQKDLEKLRQEGKVTRDEFAAERDKLKSLRETIISSMSQ